jgi:hypothetical protein
MEKVKSGTGPMVNKIFLILALAVFCTFSAQVFAGEPRLLKAYGDWEAYFFEEGGSKVCYMAAKPKKNEGEYKARGDIHALITHRPGEGSRNVFSYIAGYSYKPASDATIEIDGQKFVLFTKDDTAWAVDAEDDDKIAAAIRSGTNMTISGVSSRGTKTKDTYSLSGSSGAYERISKECGG